MASRDFDLLYGTFTGGSPSIIQGLEKMGWNSAGTGTINSSMELASWLMSLKQ